MYGSIGEGRPTDAGGPRFDPQCPLFHQPHIIYQVHCDMQLARCSHNVVNYMVLGLGENMRRSKIRGGIEQRPYYTYVYIYIYIYTICAYIYIYIYRYIYIYIIHIHLCDICVRMHIYK